MTIPAVSDLTPEQVHDAAQAYLDLMGLLLGALHECTHGYAFVSRNDSGTGFIISGHVPQDLAAAILAASEDRP